MLSLPEELQQKLNTAEGPAKVSALTKLQPEQSAVVTIVYENAGRTPALNFRNLTVVQFRGTPGT